MASRQPQENVTASLDIPFILEKLDQGICFIESSDGQDLVLVVGNTGVGKSTTCNYLKGHPMRTRFYEGLSVVETADETDITIGHEINAETLYAKGVMAADPCFPDSHVCLVDCPGFLGNRTIEECVVESISTELAIRSGRQVKGVLVLLSYLSLVESRMHEIRELLQTLMALFKNPLEMVDHTVFVVTKSSEPSTEEGLALTLTRMRKMKKYAEEEAQKLLDNRGLHSSSGFTVHDYHKIAGYFSAVLGSADRVVMVDPLDNGESRARIFQKINRIEPRKGYTEKVGAASKRTIGLDSTGVIRPITIDDFNFSDYTKHRVTFDKAVYFRVEEGTGLIRKIESTSERFLNINSKISDCERSIVQLRELHINLEEEIARAHDGQTEQQNTSYESVRTFENMLEKNTASRVAKERELEEGEQRRKKLVEELRKLDVDDEKLFCRDPAQVLNHPWWIKAIKVILGLGLETVREFEFDTGDQSVPIINVKKDKDKNGKWRNERDTRRSGTYSIDYVADFLADGSWAWVEVYIRNKDDAAVRVRMRQIRDELEALDAQQSEKMSEIEKLAKDAESLRSSIKQSKDDEEGYRRGLEQRLDECERDISRYEREVQQLLSEKEETRHLQLELLQEFADNRPKLDMIVTIDRLLAFKSNLVKNFVAEYKAFLSRLGHYASISVDATDEPTLSPPEWRAPKKSAGAIKDLVLEPKVDSASNEPSPQSKNCTASLRNLSLVQKKLDEAYSTTTSNNGQDLVLVLGVPGVGKSTTCNYLVGHAMRTRSCEGRTVVETAGETVITIGHEIMAETLCAKCVVTNDSSVPGRQLCLVDCPGFSPNQAIEDYTLSSVSTELAIRGGRRIKGILLLLSYPSILEPRMHEMSELMRILGKLFQNPIEMVDHSAFVVTKNFHDSAERGLAITLSRLEALVEYTGRNGDDQIAGFFSAVLRNRNRFVVVDPLDSGESRMRIFQAINLIENGIRPITVDNFKFEEHRTAFNRLAESRVREGLDLVERINSTRDRFRTISDEIANSRIRLGQEQGHFEEDVSHHNTEMRRLQDEKMELRRLGLHLVQKLAAIRPDIESVSSLVSSMHRLESPFPFERQCFYLEEFSSNLDDLRSSFD